MELLINHENNLQKAADDFEEEIARAGRRQSLRIQAGEAHYKKVKKHWEDFYKNLSDEGADSAAIKTLVEEKEKSLASAKAEVRAAAQTLHAEQFKLVSAGRVLSEETRKSFEIYYAALKKLDDELLEKEKEIKTKFKEDLRNLVSTLK